MSWKLCDDYISAHIDHVIKLFVAVKLSVEALSRRDANLLTAKTTFHFFFDTLNE